MGIALGLVVLQLCVSTQRDSLTVEVGRFGQEVSTSFSVKQGLPSDDTTCVAVTSDGAVYAGTTGGLAVYDGTSWSPVGGFNDVFVAALAPSDGGGMFVASGTELAHVPSGRVIALPPEAKPLSLTAANGNAYLGTDKGLYVLSGGEFAEVTSLNRLLGENTSVNGIAAAAGGGLAVAAAAGLFESRADGMWERLFPTQGDRSWALVDVRTVAYDSQDRLWFASRQGVGCFDGEWTLYTGFEGLPYNDFTSMAVSEIGELWFSTRIGVVRFDGAQWAYREGMRWVPNNDVRAVAVTSNGDAWLATAGGVGLIERRPMTLAEKAKFFDDEIDKRHKRTPHGYVQWIRLARAGDKSEWTYRDDDNDGQYTGMYGAAQCFAYAATKDPKARERATAAFEALRFLWEVAQGGTHPAPGFVARTILPTDGPNPNELEEYTIAADEKKRDTEDALWKVICPRWPVSADGKWYWKCDTSSDELDGHYFLYGRYFDLVAETEEEKNRVREVVASLTDHLIEHDFRLVDWDGKPTRWANFSPGSLNADPNWWPERGLNSLSMLAYLRVAERVTGDAKYGACADRLIKECSYAMNGMYPKNQHGPGSFVQFDDEMAFLNYYSLLRYEKDPKLRMMFADSCSRYWQQEECERNSFINFVYAAGCDGEKVTSPWGSRDVSPTLRCIEDAVDTLKRFPLDRFDWRHTNSHRKDIVPLPAYRRDPGEAEGLGCRVDGSVIPIDERYMHLWADDPWRMDSGGSGGVLADGSAFLLAYYMGLYHGFIVEPQVNPDGR